MNITSHPISTSSTCSVQVPIAKRPGKRPRIADGFKSVEWGPPKGKCPFCDSALWVIQHRTRRLQTLVGRYEIHARDCGCESPECRNRGIIYRPAEELRLALPRREFGLDVVCIILEKYLENSTSLSAIHKLLTDEYDLQISPSHVGNLLHFGLALVISRDVSSEHLRARLREQGGIVISIDAVSCPAFRDTKCGGRRLSFRRGQRTRYPCSRDR